MTPCDNHCFNCKYSHKNSNDLLSPVIFVSPPLNISVIDPPHLSLVRKQSSRSSQNTRCYNRCFNFKCIHSNSKDLSSYGITVTPPLKDSTINPPQISLVRQQSSRSSQNTTPESQVSSIPGRTSDDPSNTMPPPSTNNGCRNIYGFMVDVSKLTPAQHQQHAVMLLQNYHELCNTNDPSSMFVYPPPIPNIE